jgi:Phycobilisome protein
VIWIRCLFGVYLTRISVAGFFKIDLTVLLREGWSMAIEMSDAIKDLIRKSRIMDFSRWRPGHPPESIALFQVADDERRYLTDEDFGQIEALAPKKVALVSVARLLRDDATAIVDEARSKVLEKYPGIADPNGNLFPAERAEACWRDFWHFLRSVTYGLAGGVREYTSQLGLHHMDALYREMLVPLDAMVTGLESLKVASLARIEDVETRSIVGPYFDHLILHLEHFDDD